MGTNPISDTKTPTGFSMFKGIKRVFAVDLCDEHKGDKLEDGWEGLVSAQEKMTSCVPWSKTRPATALQTLRRLECVLTPMSKATKAMAEKPMPSSVKY